MSLSKIQSELKAPKGQMNKFGGYRYRSCEDIVEAVKPILAKHDAALVIHDEIVMVGDRIYVKATAEVSIGKDIHRATAYAREPLSKKGMDEAQITGSTSSYARKYALNGLFAIDDTKDADATNEHKDEPDTSKVEKAYAYLVQTIDADMHDDEIAAKIKAAWSRLSNDEQIEVNNRLKSVKVDGGRKQYNTILREYLNYEVAA